MKDAFLFVMGWLWVPAVAWLLFGLPWYARRSKRRSEARRREFWRQMREVELAIAVRAPDGEDYLRRRLLADLRELRTKRRVRAWLDEEMERELAAWKGSRYVKRIIRKSYEEVRP